MATKKEYLSRRLYDLLASQSRTQVQLAEYCRISQGLVANHLSLRKNGYPKIEILIKYARFFRVTLYELTGNSMFKGIEFEAATLRPTDEEIDLLRRYNDLSESHWLKQAINDILMGNRKTLKEGPDEETDDT